MARTGLFLLISVFLIVSINFWVFVIIGFDSDESSSRIDSYDSGIRIIDDLAVSDSGEVSQSFESDVLDGDFGGRIVSGGSSVGRSSGRGSSQGSSGGSGSSGGVSSSGENSLGLEDNNLKKIETGVSSESLSNSPGLIEYKFEKNGINYTVMVNSDIDISLIKEDLENAIVNMSLSSEFLVESSASNAEPSGPDVGFCQSFLCNNDNSESGEGPGGSYCCSGSAPGGYEECTNYLTKSTASTSSGSKTDYCSGETLNEVYIDCNAGADSTNYKSKNCNDFNFYSSWSYFCTPTQVGRVRNYNNFGCSTGACYLASSTNEYETVSEKGSSDYCSKRKEGVNSGWSGCTLCGHEDYDCDLNSECSSGLQCKGPIGGSFDGCCYSNENWNTNTRECEPQCQSQDYYSCYDSDVYWYNSCNVREDKKQECGSDSCGDYGSNYCKSGDVYKQRTCFDKGCSSNSCFSNSNVEEVKVQDCSNGCTNGACNECDENSDCGSGEKCVSNKCVDKTCDDYSLAKGSCNPLNPDHADGECIESNVYQCSVFGNVNCFSLKDNCTAKNEICEDKTLEPAQCKKKDSCGVSSSVFVDISQSSAEPKYPIDEGKEVHQWIAYQAKFVWSNSEIDNYIHNYDVSLDPDCYNTGEGIIEGAGEEDKCKEETWLPFFGHFWNPDSPRGGAYSDGLNNALCPSGECESAYQRAQTFYYKAINYYNAGDKGRAYYYLGRVAHLLEDMAVPAHTFNDPHPGFGTEENFGGDDKYEEFSGGEGILNNAWCDGDNFKHFKGSSYVGKQYDYNNLPWWDNNVKSNPSDLFRLFYYTAQRTQHFASDDYDGNNFYEVLNGNLYCFGGSCSDYDYLWDGDSITIIKENTDIEANGEANVGNLKKVAEANIPHAIKAVAGLYKLFWEETHPVICEPDYRTACYDNDLYWYNSCNERGGKLGECGDSGYAGGNYCFDNDVYRVYIERSCVDDEACLEEGKGVKQEECPNGCSNGACVSPPPCTNECSTSGAKQCSGNGYQTCGNYDSDSCLEWSSVVNCPSGQTCSNGQCVSSCTPHTSSSCFDNDLYWYNSCNQKEDKKQECGDDSCGNYGSNYCKSGDVYKQRTCFDKGCSSNSCFSNSNVEEVKVQECGALSCSNGDCVEVECSLNSDCGETGYTGSNYCFDDDVYRDYVTRWCSNQLCIESVDKIKQQECGSLGCNNEVCVSPPPCTNECSVVGSRQCSGNNLQTCGNYDGDNCSEWGGDVTCQYGCSDNQCNSQPCMPHASSSCFDNDVYWYNSCNQKEEKKEECGVSGYTGSNYCFSGDVYRDFVTRGCSGNSCTSSTSKQKQQECGALSCSNGVCVQSCTNECSTSGAKQCSGNNLQTCGNYDSDSCLEWGNNVNCPDGCSNGACIELESRTVNLPAGTSLFSLPLIPQGGSVTFNELNSNCVIVSGGPTCGGANLAYLNPDTGKYVCVDRNSDLYPGQGYFVKTLVSCQFTVQGDEFEADDIGYLGNEGIKKGQNLIGAPSSSVDFEDVKGNCEIDEPLLYNFKKNSCSGVAFYSGTSYCGKDSSGFDYCYCSVSKLETGKGYNVYSEEFCKLG